jgi:hypothetical protein
MGGSGADVIRCLLCQVPLMEPDPFDRMGVACVPIPGAPLAVLMTAADSDPTRSIGSGYLCGPCAVPTMREPAQTLPPPQVRRWDGQVVRY